MSFSTVIGQHRAKGILSKAIENDRVPHAYLFNGPVGVGKEALAIEFAKALFCTGAGEKPCDECSSCRRIHSFQHPDFMFVFPSSAKNVDEVRAILDTVMENPYARQQPWAVPTIGIEQIREIRHTATLKPLEGKRVVIIAEADRMTIPAANSILKILEEPPETMHLILTASRVNGMLPTILSRCQEIRFGPLPDNKVEWALVEKQIEPERAKLISRISQGSYSRALEWLDESFNERRDSAVEFLRFCLKDPQSQIELVETLLRQYDKKVIKDILSLTLMWFRDALMLMEQGEQAERHLVNVDQLETLKKFVGAFESIDFQTAFAEIENSISMIERSIQMNLILIVLMTKLRDVLKLKGRKI